MPLRILAARGVRCVRAPLAAALRAAMICYHLRAQPKTVFERSAAKEMRGVWPAGHPCYRLFGSHRA